MQQMECQIEAPKAVGMSNRPLIMLKNVSKRFPGVVALDKCEFELHAGEVHALMGENGAGKSTLMKILSGVYQKDEGEIWLDGQLVEISSPRNAQQLGISIIHQELHLMQHLTVAQNMFIGREPRRWDRFFLDDVALDHQTKAIFDYLHLDLDPHTRVNELTVAKQQMVEIAKALSFHARVLIMDEPTAALNDNEIEELFRIIRQLQTQGVGIIYISHKMDELQRISNRVTVMRDGHYIATVSTATTPVERIISMMVGRQLLHDHRVRPDTSTNPVVLEARGISRARVLRDVNFVLRQGEILGFSGLMGAGRTELARAIFGADRIDRGEIYVRGIKATINSPRDAVALGIGYLSEDRKHFGLATGLDVQTNIVLTNMPRFITKLFFLNQLAIRRTAERFIQQLAVKTPSAGQAVGLLSGGNQQKIVIAKWLLRDCDILFFDEPTRGIDVGAKQEIYKLIKELSEQGKAIVMISSELPEIMHLSHRIVVMREGRIAGELSAAQASQEKIMQLATQGAVSNA